MNDSRSQIVSTPSGITVIEFGDARCVGRRAPVPSNRVRRRRRWSGVRRPSTSRSAPRRPA